MSSLILPTRCEHCNGKSPLVVTTPTSSKFIDLTGQVFTRLTVCHCVGIAKRFAYWCCACSCGAYSIVAGAYLRSGTPKSCGCLISDSARKHQTKHGLTHTRVYGIWCGIIARCTNPRTKNFHRYGGRGIAICDRWRDSFEAFYADMGEPPEGMSIERRDNNFGYSPENCYWATVEQQANNTRGNRVVVYQGERHTIAEWSRIIGLPYKALALRIERGWDTNRAMTQPLRITPQTTMLVDDREAHAAADRELADD